jgi:hypothetical protein
MLPDALGEQSGAKGARTRVITVGWAFSVTSFWPIAVTSVPTNFHKVSPHDGPSPQSQPPTRTRISSQSGVLTKLAKNSLQK